MWRVKLGSCFRHIRKEPELPRQLQDDGSVELRAMPHNARIIRILPSTQVAW